MQQNKILPIYTLGQFISWKVQNRSLNQQTYHTTLSSVIIFDYTDSMSKVKHILTSSFVHKETLNLEYVNKTSGVTLILENLLTQQDIVCCKNILQQRKNGSFCKNLTKRRHRFLSQIKNLIWFWYLVKKQEQMATFNLEALCIRWGIKSGHLKIWVETLSIATVINSDMTLKKPVLCFNLH